MTKDAKTIVFLPKLILGSALSCIGLAQQLRTMGHRPIFICADSMLNVFSDYGFPVVPLPLATPVDVLTENGSHTFIARHVPYFRQSPAQQIGSFVSSVWHKMLDIVIAAEQGLRTLLATLQPHLICLESDILFPAVKQAGCPWTRIVSSAENQFPDTAIPPFLSGCGERDRACFASFRQHYEQHIGPIHERFNLFLRSVGEAGYPAGQFLEPSPYMNLLLYPAALNYRRRQPLAADRFRYLQGCMRSEESYDIPSFRAREDQPLIYVNLGKFGAADTDLMQRMIASFSKLPYRFLVNIGAYREHYATPPANVHLAGWYPQPSIIPLVDLVIHQGGCNSFNEALYFGKPALAMPLCWDGHDNARRLQDTGYGLRLAPYAWDTKILAGHIETLLGDADIQKHLHSLSQHMQRAGGRQSAAEQLLEHAR